jgi:hypothetical protein
MDDMQARSPRDFYRIRKEKKSREKSRFVFANPVEYNSTYPFKKNI